MFDRSLAAALLFASASALAMTPLAAAEREISGSAIYLMRIALSPDAELAVEARGAGDAVLASLRQPTEGAQVPLPFTLAVPAPAPVELRLGIFAEGTLRWLADPVEVEAGDTPVALGEIRVTPWRPIGFSEEMRCGDRRIRAGFDGERALLDTGEGPDAGRGTVELAQAISASGARYLSGDGTVEFWTKGEGAMLTIDGTALPDCTLVLPEAQRDWRATGNEPGWLVEVSGGAVTLTGQGAEPLSTQLPTAGIGEGAFRYDLADLGRVLVVRDEVCRDTMTGMPHPQSVSVEQDGTVLSGCGGDPLQLIRGGEWRIEDVAGGGIIDGSNLTLAVSRDARVFGSGGCNRYSGSLLLTGEGLSFGPVAGTMMACAEALMAQEARVFAALSEVTGFDIGADGALHLLAGDTTVLLARR